MTEWDVNFAHVEVILALVNYLSVYAWTTYVPYSSQVSVTKDALQHR